MVCIDCIYEREMVFCKFSEYFIKFKQQSAFIGVKLFAIVSLPISIMKSNLYTRTGDSGKTSLVGGQRVPKDCLRLEAYGTLDEFSAFLGVVLSAHNCEPKEKEHLLDIQNRLFDLGAYLATLPPEGKKPLLEGMDLCIEQVEKWIDYLDNTTPKANAFILPGGTELAAHTHVARTVCRRTERAILRLANQEWVDPRLIVYINRLSDYLFILARYFNHIAGVEEIKWKVGITTKK